MNDILKSIDSPDREKLLDYLSDLQRNLNLSDDTMREIAKIVVIAWLSGYVSTLEKSNDAAAQVAVERIIDRLNFMQVEPGETYLWN